ncbi:hypothetical protein [Vibrio mediterranei]|uniref:hypothetical protein n=1 Tax=Vibrio mediterranei TaxID=689 RepID=UPI002283B0E4|nr:hypothetical protein [Vibrio mediterranei]MCY9855427.1 hypothetical protein [Vibrio mediterranei]
METKGAAISTEEWAAIQERLASGSPVCERFLYKGHKIQVQRVLVSESRTLLAVYIDGEIKGAWLLSDSKVERPTVIDDVWFLKTRSNYSSNYIREAEKAFGKRAVKKHIPDLHGKYQYRIPYFNKASSLVRQFKKLDGIALDLSKDTNDEK